MIEPSINARIKQLARDVARKCMESPRTEIFDRADWHVRAFALEIERVIRKGKACTNHLVITTGR